MQTTPLYDKHLASGGKIVEFSGWQLPVQYKGIIEEHQAVRQHAGLFDVSHMGEFFVQGPQALEFLQHLLTNDLSKMQEKQILYSPMCYPNGGTVDDLLVYKFAADKFMLVVNAGNSAKDWEWIQAAAKNFQVQLHDASSEFALLALQGPCAAQILQPMVTFDLSTLKYYWFEPNCKLDYVPAIISRTGYTGEDGFEIYLPPEQAPRIWDLLLTVGKNLGLMPAGLGCRDTLRFECCMPLYGHELSPEITPLMAGLGGTVKLDKPDFIGKQALTEQKANGPARRLVGLEITGRGIARAEYPVAHQGQVIGLVTTGSPAPSLGKNLALALVDVAYVAPGTELEVIIRGKPVAARVIPRPFYKRI